MDGLNPPLVRNRLLGEFLAVWRSYRRQSQAALANWTIVFVGLFVLQGVTAVTSVIVARRVAPVEYGQYLSSLGLASLLIVLPSFGMDTLLLSRGGLQAERLEQLWLRLLRLRLVLLGLWLALMGLLAWVLPADTYPAWVLWPTALALALESLVLLSHAALRSVGLHGWVTALQIVATVGLLGVTLLMGLQPGQIARFSLSRAVIWGVVTPLSLVATWRIVRRPREPRPDVPPASAAASGAMPFLVSDLAAAVYTRAPLTVVSLFLGSAGATAFGPASNLIFFTFLVPNALYFVVVPLLSRVFSARPDLFRRVAWGQAAVQGLAGLVISFATFLLGAQFIVRLLGADYAASTVSLLLLSPLPVLKSLNFGVAAILTAGERQSFRAVTQVICALFNVAGGLIMVRLLGLLGVALMINLTELLLLGGCALGVLWPRPNAPHPSPASVLPDQA
jgi:O-antigen/teichoic acid export membrane protein